ncbi:hypothetical protein [Microbacterium lacticum]|uniref:hypothetical protein n=1 Tax=Microbacterium lacticum TaxID=33885 RepID=UPI0011434FBF|nr:hypothetical protein [Microbacterium lacticum]
MAHPTADRVHLMILVVWIAGFLIRGQDEVAAGDRLGARHSEQPLVDRRLIRTVGSSRSSCS